MDRLQWVQAIKELHAVSIRLAKLEDKYLSDEGKLTGTEVHEYIIYQKRAKRLRKQIDSFLEIQIKRNAIGELEKGVDNEQN